MRLTDTLDTIFFADRFTLIKQPGYFVALTKLDILPVGRYSNPGPK